MKSASADTSHRLVGQSPQIRQIRHLIEKISRSRSPVLLLGETGVGKEVIARAIHNGNPAGDLVPIDCGSLVGALMESELFGHTKGAFTGADAAKRGLIELANGGTAFFDEIGDLPLDMQVRLLRVLQEGEYRPVGSLVQHRVDVRVIAATHRDLAAEVKRGTFREDLFYRLHVITVRIPALRERPDDIPPLIDYFLEKLCARYTLTAEAREALMVYPWPGNVRELWNCLQRMTALNSGPLLHRADLPSSVLNHVVARRGEQRCVAVAVAGVGTGARAIGEPPPVAPEAATDSGDLEILPLSEVERRAILQALEYTKGDRAMAAHLLGIGRTTLYRKLKEYRIDGNRPAGGSGCDI